MRLEGQTAAEIAARSSTFRERLSNHTLVPSESDGRAADRRRKQWLAKAAHGDESVFDETLALQGLDRDRIRRALGPVQLAPGAELPDWIGWLNEGLALFGPGLEDRPFLQDGEPVPHERILAPFVEAATKRLAGRSPQWSRMLPAAAQASSQRTLLKALAGICQSSLEMEFALFRLGRQDSPLTAKLAAPVPSECLDFARHMAAGAIIKFFTEYAVLARGVPLSMRNWTESNAEFAGRLDRDLQAIEETFGGGRPLGPLVDIETGLSDPHNQGRTVIGITFESGVKILYKPKSLETEAAYARLLEWINTLGTELRLRPVQVIERDGYGWVEYIRHETCASEEERHRFYRRAGMLLALFGLLGTTDVHAENLIAAGEHPVMIDAETLITPNVEDWGSPGENGEEYHAHVLAARESLRSVDRVGMLPWFRVSGETFVDTSAFGARVGWDRELPRTGQTIGSTKHLPFADPRNRDIGPYAGDVAAGYRSLYEALSRHRDALLEPGSPLQRLSGCAMRLVFRDTYIYYNLLHASFDSRCTRDGADRSVELESLSWLLAISNPRSRYLPFVESERRAIERLDIPVFAFEPLHRHLVTGPGETAPGYFSRSSFEGVREAILEMSPEAAAAQERRIRDSFTAKRATMLIQEMLRLAPEPHAAPFAPWNEAAALAAAGDIARGMRDRAVSGAGGSIVWEGFAWDPARQLVTPAPSAARFGEGLGDIILFLSALEAHGPGAEARAYLEGALRAVEGAIQLLEERPGERNSKTPDLMFSSLVLPLAVSASWTGDPAMQALAKRALGFLTQAVLDADKHLGLVTGTAGFLLGALALDELSGVPGALDKAILCGDHLLARRKDWPAPSGIPDIGFARGLAGVSAALARLAAKTGQERFLDAAKAAFQHERNRRGEGRGESGWAEGRTGFGYACLAMLPYVREEAEPELELAIAVASEPPDVALDSVHSGLFGHADFLITASKELGRPGLADRARAIAAWSVERAAGRGGFAMIPGADPGAWGPGYFLGAAGIGYTLLRCVNGSLPPVSAWRTA